MSAPSGGDFGKPAHAAAHVQHQLSLQILGLESALLYEIRLREIAAGVIQLGLAKLLPLISEAVGIVGLVDETKHAPDLRELPPAGGAGIAVLLSGERTAADGTAEEKRRLLGN